jgi:RNA polymerase sigma-70 factor (ECF subfamily)
VRSQWQRIRYGLLDVVPSRQYGAPVSSVGHETASAADHELVARLRAGDEQEFMRLVGELGPSLLRVARLYVRTRATAEEVVQETWLGVLNGLDRFEGRSSLKTWIFRILTNTAKTRGVRESRSIPFSALGDDVGDEGDSTVDPDRFLAEGEYAGHWATSPRAWSQPDERLEAAETRAVIENAIAELPESQRTVITLRDVEGWSAEEVCNVLDLTETNQRVLLHRARAKVRRALDDYLEPGP